MTPGRALIFITSLASNSLRDLGLMPSHFGNFITALLRGASNNNSDQSGNLSIYRLKFYHVMVEIIQDNINILLNHVKAKRMPGR